jgi:hypothetical protein
MNELNDKNLRNDFLNAHKYLAEADSWDELLWDYFDGDDIFNGDAKSLNQGVARGINLYLCEPDKYEAYNEGWTMGCGWSIPTLVQYISRWA